MAMAVGLQMFFLDRLLYKYKSNMIFNNFREVYKSVNCHSPPLSTY
jgi:hypothetical protein